ncbi:MAG: hypothetical protein KGZ96_05785 [Clostridia bacterium]|nr:hypothetical protein [Clostridia bacterium]
MTDVLGFKLIDAEAILREKGINWSIEYTFSPKQHTFGESKGEFRVVRQKLILENKILLTIVKESEKEVILNGN